MMGRYSITFAAPVRWLTLLLLALIVGAGCRGKPSARSPIHPNPNMDDQWKYAAQTESPLFADGKAMRPPVPGTVARGQLRADAAYYEGKAADGTFIASLPAQVTVDMALLERGRDRFDIYCAVCHGATGHADGIITQRGERGMVVPPPSFHDPGVRAKPAGFYFDVITHGVRGPTGAQGRMLPYKHQVPVADRWAIVAYMRALQRSQSASLNDIPVEHRARLEAERLQLLDGK
jgi:mono/diheme cytochrome c family protein